MFLWLNKLNKQTDFKRTTQFHTVLLCLYVADPATFLASNSVLGTLFSFESSLFIQSWKILGFWVLIYFRKLHSAPLMSQSYMVTYSYLVQQQVQRSIAHKLCDYAEELGLVADAKNLDDVVEPGFVEHFRLLQQAVPLSETQPVKQSQTESSRWQNSNDIYSAVCAHTHEKLAKGMTPGSWLSVGLGNGQMLLSQYHLDNLKYIWYVKSCVTLSNRPFKVSDKPIY